MNTLSASTTARAEGSTSSSNQHVNALEQKSGADTDLSKASFPERSSLFSKLRDLLPFSFEKKMPEQFLVKQKDYERLNIHENERVDLAQAGISKKELQSVQDLISEVSENEERFAQAHIPTDQFTHELHPEIRPEDMQAAIDLTQKMEERLEEKRGIRGFLHRCKCKVIDFVENCFFHVQQAKRNLFHRAVEIKEAATEKGKTVIQKIKAVAEKTFTLIRDVISGKIFKQRQPEKKQSSLSVASEKYLALCLIKDEVNLHHHIYDGSRNDQRTFLKSLIEEKLEDIQRACQAVEEASVEKKKEKKEQRERQRKDTGEFRDSQIERVKSLVPGAIDHPALLNYLVEQFRVNVSTDEIIAMLRMHCDSALQNEVFCQQVTDALQEKSQEKVAA